MCGWCCNTILIDTIILPQNSGQPCQDFFSGDMFIAKFNSSGHGIWAKRFECEYQCDFNDLVVTDDGLYICGSTAGFIRLDSTNLGGGSAFICKFMLSGELGWFKSFTGYNLGILINPLQDSLQLILSFGNGASLNNQILLNNGEKGIIFSRISKNGDINIKSIQHNTDVFLAAKSIDSNRNMYIVGNSGGSTYFGQFYIKPQSNNLFIAKVTPSDSVIWLKTPSFSHSDATGMSVGTLDIKWVSTDNIFLSGSFNGILAFDLDTLRIDTLLAPSIDMRFDGFIFAFNNSGQAEWGQKFAGPKKDVINGISQKENSTIFLTGEYDSIATFMQTNFTSHGKNDAFLCRVTIDSTLNIKKSINYNKSLASNQAQYYLGFLNKKHLTDNYTCFDLLGKRIIPNNTKGNLNYIGKLTIIHKN
jgi:hypothetical protein